MTSLTFAARRPTFNLLWCAVVTLGLAACGSDDGPGGAAAAAAQSGSPARLISPKSGMINRWPGSVSPPLTDTVASNTPPTGSTPTTTTPNSGATTDGGKHATTGSATLDWTPPTENNDGTMLTNLAGYTVYYGTSPDNLSKSLKITNPGLTAYTVTELSSGTWYFAVSAYSSAGTESSRTATVSTTI